MISVFTKHRWASFLLMCVLLFSIIGPIDNAKISGARQAASFDRMDTLYPGAGVRGMAPALRSVPLTAMRGRVQPLHVQEPPDRPTVVQLLQSNIKSKEQWMRLTKSVPLLHTGKYQGLKEVEVTATGYFAGVESTGKSPGHAQYGITYSGVKVRRDIFSTIAADRRVFPIGTILHIPGYGYGVVADTGSAIKGKKIDLYFHTKQQIYDEWGKKKVKVRVIQWGDGKLTEQELERLNNLNLENNVRKLSV